jgi:ABC-2 type transport system ATP-binding protein
MNRRNARSGFQAFLEGETVSASQAVAQIEVTNLSKTYRVPERQEGLKAALHSLVRRRTQSVPAVQEISFSIEAGEVVGFIGPNGAGKTTTLKIIAGLLYPSAGEARVAGEIPWQRKPAYLRQISMVMGNKSQVMWDIPPLDSYAVLGEIYQVPRRVLRQRIDELAALLEITDLLTKPARNLSLGERMKCELVAALLHYPAVLFLDEPTLGLDVSTQRRLRDFIGEYNRRTGATIILTSHYMADVQALCPRLLVIHQGRLIYDGPLAQLVQRMAPFKLIQLTLDSERRDLEMTLPAGAEVIEQDAARLTLRANRAATPAITAQLLQTLPIVDLAVEEPAIEAVIDQIYSAQSVAGELSAGQLQTRQTANGQLAAGGEA